MSLLDDVKEAGCYCNADEDRHCAECIEELRPRIVAALEVLDRLTATSWHALISTVQVLPAMRAAREGACRICHQLLESEGHDPACIVPEFEKDVRAAQSLMAASEPASS